MATESPFPRQKSLSGLFLSLPILPAVTGIRDVVANSSANIVPRTATEYFEITDTIHGILLTKKKVYCFSVLGTVPEAFQLQNLIYRYSKEYLWIR